MARWITIIPAAVPFDYRWPDRSAITAFTQAGEFFVKDEVADFATGRGYATEGKKQGSTTRSTKGKSRPARKAVTAKADAASDHRSNARLAGTGMAAHDSAALRGAVDPPAGER